MKKVLFTLIAVSMSLTHVNAEDNGELEAEVTNVGSEEAEASGELFNNAYLAYGVGGSFFHSGDTKFNRCMGSVGLGVGRAFNKIYVGGECLMDMMRAKSEENYALRSNGFHTNVSLKAGWINNGTTLVYGKFGGMHSKGRYHGSDKSKFSSLIGTGVYRAFSMKYGAGFEADYSTGFKENGKKINQGWNLRVLLHYNVPL